VGWKQIAANELQLQDAAEVLGRVFLQFRTLYPYCRILERLRQARDDRRQGMTADPDPDRTSL